MQGAGIAAEMDNSAQIAVKAKLEAQREEDAKRSAAAAKAHEKEHKANVKRLSMQGAGIAAEMDNSAHTVYKAELDLRNEGYAVQAAESQAEHEKNVRETAKELAAR